MYSITFSTSLRGLSRSDSNNSSDISEDKENNHNHGNHAIQGPLIFGSCCKKQSTQSVAKCADLSEQSLGKTKNRNSSNGDQEQHPGRYHDLFRLLACIEHRIIKKSPGFDHYTVNHLYNFFDPTTGAHTQMIERLWGSAKWRNKNIGTCFPPQKND
ncbi:dual specificity protein phosphatase CDC14B-like [Aphis craccivora]|uniref:Dual specificity protein phosphatase CDC14B-like n=1 Tax=Aphis craccivora TaxID=307492 RepID=A0A6G0YBE8_APHCR|nr:dual specificity protein phosphatase CDC14B-like [Aphis craccivora]